MMKDSYDSLLESGPEIQDMLEKREIASKRESILWMVEARFPELVETAQQRVARVNKIDELNLLFKLVAGAPNENVAEYVLERTAA